jgi:hypothetical protein
MFRWVLRALITLSSMVCFCSVVVWTRSYLAYDSTVHLRGGLDDLVPATGKVYWKRRSAKGVDFENISGPSRNWGFLGLASYRVDRGEKYVRQWTIPYWMPATVSAIAPAAWMGSLLVGRSRRRAAAARGLCAECGYDLRAIPDRCPECGARRDSEPRP